MLPQLLTINSLIYLAQLLLTPVSCLSVMILTSHLPLGILGAECWIKYGKWECQERPELSHSGPLGSDSHWGVMMLTMNGKRGRGKACGVCRGQRGAGALYTQLLSLGSLPRAEDMEKSCLGILPWVPRNKVQLCSFGKLSCEFKQTTGISQHSKSGKH